MDFFYYYLVIINAIGLLIMPIDKDNAKRGWRRVPELSLLTIAFIGGSMGICLGIYIFRHKTKKRMFKTIVFLLVAFHISIYVLSRLGANL